MVIGDWCDVSMGRDIGWLSSSESLPNTSAWLNATARGEGDTGVGASREDVAVVMVSGVTKAEDNTD